MNKTCIGCSFCCRKGPCIFVSFVSEDVSTFPWKGCPKLKWDGEKWRCGAYEEARGTWKTYIAHVLAMGEGCCSSMNTYRRKNHVPTPEELKDEKSLLRKLEEA